MALSRKALQKAREEIEKTEKDRNRKELILHGEKVQFPGRSNHQA